MQIIVPLTYAEIEDIHPNEGDLLNKLALLNRKETVLFLAMVNLLLSLYQKDWRAFVKVQGRLYQSLITPEMKETIRKKFPNEQMGSRPLFHRNQVLSLLKRSLLHCPEDGGYDLSSKKQGWHELGLAALMMSDIIDTKEKQEKIKYNPDDSADTKRANEEIFAQMLPGIELLNPPDMIHSFVRNAEYFEIFKRQAAKGKLLFTNDRSLNDRSLFDKFKEITELDLNTYLRMIISLVFCYLSLAQKKPEELIIDPRSFNINAKETFEKMRFTDAELTAFFSLSALPVGAIEQRVREHQESVGLPEEYDFTIMRRYPLVFTREAQDIMTCFDVGFLIEKTGNGVYFTIHNSLKDREAESDEARRDHKSFMTHWGTAFEIYVNDRLWDDRYSSGLRDLYLAPKFTDAPNGQYHEAFDAVLDYKSRLVVMEHKGKFARLKPRCSGDREELLKELKGGDIVGGAVSQIARNLGFVFNEQSSSRHTFYVQEPQRKKVYDLNYIRKVNYIYPVIIHQDFFLRMIGVTHMARDIFKEELRKYPIDITLVRPLTLLTVEDLELLIPYLKIMPLHQILEKYFLFTEPFETFQTFFAWFVKKNGIQNRPNDWIKRRSDELWDELTASFIDFSDS